MSELVDQRKSKVKKSKANNQDRTATRAWPEPRPVDNLFSEPVVSAKPTTLIKIRRAKRSDALFVADLAGKVLSEYGLYDKCLPDWLFLDGIVSLIAEKRRRPVGMAIIHLPDKMDNPGLGFIVYILAMAVSPTFQRRGVGQALMRWIINYAVKNKFENIVLHTAVANHQAINFYKKYNFEVTRLVRHYYPSGQDAFTMFLTLD
ncbi:MAG: GNAT family N-acetyltransferase [Deltaproteobacteria bacterium]|nr:GNAT family N-acetyltransferase [Deltaproteobacteria bacterium]MBF0526488.1 GNAT family N-acetyltransferase [Deltaproteobacteria bacterium]